MISKAQQYCSCFIINTFPEMLVPLQGSNTTVCCVQMSTCRRTHHCNVSVLMFICSLSIKLSYWHNSWWENYKESRGLAQSFDFVLRGTKLHSNKANCCWGISHKTSYWCWINNEYMWIYDNTWVVSRIFQSMSKSLSLKKRSESVSKNNKGLIISIIIIWGFALQIEQLYTKHIIIL